jgi:hypothetical protein
MSTSQGSQPMSIDEPTVVRRTESSEPEELMDSTQELSIRPLVLTPPVVETPEHPSGYTIHDMGPFQAWLPNAVQPDENHEEIAQPANNSERLGSRDSIRMEERPELHITNPASPAESLSSISSVSTQSTRVTQAPLLQSTPRHVTISEEFSPTRQPTWPGQGHALRDIPPHAEFITRRTSAGTRQSSGQPMVPAEEFTCISTIPEEPEDFHPAAPSNVQPSYVAHPCSTRTISINETPMRPPSVRTPELPENLGISRRGIPVTQIMAQVPLKKTVLDRHIDRNTLPKHVQDRMIASRRFSEILQSQPPRPQLADLVNPGGGDGGDGGGPGGYDRDSDKSYGHDLGSYRSRRPPGGPPDPPDGNDRNNFSFNTN